MDRRKHRKLHTASSDMLLHFVLQKRHFIIISEQARCELLPHLNSIADLLLLHKYTSEVCVEYEEAELRKSHLGFMFLLA